MTPQQKLIDIDLSPITLKGPSAENALARWITQKRKAEQEAIDKFLKALRAALAKENLTPNSIENVHHCIRVTFSSGGREFSNMVSEGIVFDCVANGYTLDLVTNFVKECRYKMESK